MTKKQARPKIKIAPNDDPRWAIVKDESLEPEERLQARNSLVEEHHPLLLQIVHTIMRKLHTGVEEGDLVAYGAFGLIKAVETYDPEKASFRTHAAFRINNAIYDGLRLEDWAPKTFRKRVKDVNVQREVLTKELNRTPTDAELGEFIGKNEEWVRTLWRSEEATRHYTMSDLEGGRDTNALESLSAFSSAHHHVENQALTQSLLDAFVAWLESLPEVLQVVWYTTYYQKRPMEHSRQELGLKSFEFSLAHKQLIQSFDQMMSELKKTLS